MSAASSPVPTVSEQHYRGLHDEWPESRCGLCQFEQRARQKELVELREKVAQLGYELEEAQHNEEAALDQVEKLEDNVRELEEARG